MTYTLEELQKIMEDSGGDLDLSETQITSLPEGLTVAGSLDLSGTPITSLPEGLTIGGWLDLSRTPITSLPEGLTVAGNLYLRGTPITSLPEGLTVGRSLCLIGTQITSLPEGLTVGGSLCLSETPITSLTQGLTVGEWINFRGTPIQNITTYKKLQNGDYVPGRYLYVDGILTHVKRKRVLHGYTYYVGKIKGQNVIYDGKNYAHCKNFKSGVEDLAFKAAKDRGAEQYRNMPVDTELTVEEAKTMYRVITGACQAGTNAFVESLGKLKEKYTIAEMIDLTRGQYGSTTFKDFWGRSEE